MEAAGDDIQQKLQGNFLQSLHLRQKQTVLKISLLIPIIICGIFGWLNFVQHHSALAAIEAVFGCVFPVLFIRVQFSSQYLKPMGLF